MLELILGGFLIGSGIILLKEHMRYMTMYTFVLPQKPEQRMIVYARGIFKPVMFKIVQNINQDMKHTYKTSSHLEVLEYTQRVMLSQLPKHLIDHMDELFKQIGIK
jgi:hypothetical protein